MSRPVQVKFDNSLPDIEVTKVLLPTSIEEGGNKTNESSEIKITGKYAPLVKLNNIVIPWSDVLAMNLSCTGWTPELSLKIRDSQKSITLLDTPGPDNLVIVEILPTFENVYKKIKLTFFIDSISSDNFAGTVSLNWKYFCEGLYNSNIESFGKISTYKFYEEIATRLKLGLCSNLEESNDDRYIFMPGSTYSESLVQERNQGGNESCILDSWIDWWNNINIVDLYDLYKGSPDTDLECWVGNNFIDTEGDKEIEPVKVEATITNNYKLKTSPLYTYTYQTNNSNSKNTVKGTDRAINLYDTKKYLNTSILVQDGTGVKNSVFTQYYYKGEYNSEISDGKYLLQKEYRDIFLQKINNNIITITLSQPCFGLMRGGKVNLEWYDSSIFNEELYKEGKDIETNIDIEPDSTTSGNLLDQSGIVLNKKISGQYYIVGTSISYKREAVEDGRGSRSILNQTFTLSKSVDTFNYSDLAKNI